MRETLGARPAVGSAGTAAGGLGEAWDLEEVTPRAPQPTETDATVTTFLLWRRGEW